jgi:hypothetical protein
MTPELWVTIIVAVVSSGAFASAISAIVNYKLSKKIKAEETKKTKEDGIASGVQILLEERIDRIAKKHIELGYIYDDDKDRLNRMWHVYHDQLDGNGHLNDIMDLVSKLEVKVRGIKQ